MTIDKILENREADYKNKEWLLEGVHDDRIKNLQYLGKTPDKYVGKTYYSVYHDNEGGIYKKVKSPVTGNIYIPC